MEEITEVTTQEETTPVVETPKVETPKVETPVVDPEQQAAVELFKALKDPERAGSTLQQLAQLAGLDLVKKADQKVLTKGIKDLVKERLGEDNSILAESLGPLLEEVLEKAVEDRLKSIKDDLTEQKRTEFAAKIEDTWTKLDTETKGLASKLEKQMLALMEDIDPGKNTPPEKYLRHIYKLAKADYDEAEKIKAQNTKRDQNKKAPSVQTGVNADRVKSGSRLPTIKEAVEAAVRGETLE